MSLPRIPPPPRSTPPPTGDLISLDTPLPVDDRNPHLQVYTGPSADFSQPPHESPPRTQHHTYPRRQPPRRLSQIALAAGPTSPPAVSAADSGNAGFILPNSPSDEFGVFKSAPTAPTAGGESKGSPPGRQRRISSIDNLWKGLHLGPGAVGAFPAQKTSERDKEQGRARDVFHEDDEGHGAGEELSGSSHSPQHGPGWRHSLASSLGGTLKAKSKWKTVLGPSTFHPASPVVPSGYTLHGLMDDSPFSSADTHTPTPTAKPISITHQSPFAPAASLAPSTGSSSFGNPYVNPLSGAPGFTRADTYLAASRPTPPSPPRAEDVQVREWSGTLLLGRREGTDVVLDQYAADALRPFLPPRQRLARSWTLLFSTDQHGASLSTFYRLIDAYALKAPQAGNVLVVRDAHGARFGVFMNEAIRRVEGAYTGSGESWLFKLVGEQADVGARVFKWTGKNHYFALCESDFISFGGGDGRFGLWLDRNFYKGSSARCPAYDNEVLCDPPGSMRESATFECYGLEVWAT